MSRPHPTINITPVKPVITITKVDKSSTKKEEQSPPTTSPSKSSSSSAPITVTKSSAVDLQTRVLEKGLMLVNHTESLMEAIVNDDKDKSLKEIKEVLSCLISMCYTAQLPAVSAASPLSEAKSKIK